MAQGFAKTFYNTHRWKKCRNAYIQKRLMIDGGLCEECHDQQGYIVHHKITITESNVNDCDVVLNEKNLMYVCKVCHDAYEGHGAGGHGKAKALCTFDAFGNPISGREIDKGGGEPIGTGIPPYSRHEKISPKKPRRRTSWFFCAISSAMRSVFFSMKGTISFAGGMCFFLKAIDLAVKAGFMIGLSGRNGGQIMRDLSILTWKEVKEIDKRKSIVFVVFAPIEEHGTHLPLATDLMEGEYWSVGAMKELEVRLQAECFSLPSFPIASASVNEFYGSIHFPMKVTYEAAYAVLESLRYMGFQNIVVIASHADPQHQIAIEKAVRKINKKNGLCVIAPMGQIFMGVSVQKAAVLQKLEKEHGNDYHAGWVETSCMLHIDPENVREGYQNLPDTQITDKDMISCKRQLKAMGNYGYIGAPRYTSMEAGKALNDNCIASICDAVEKFYRREDYQKYGNYRLYKILPLHIGFLKIAGKVRRRKVSE